MIFVDLIAQQGWKQKADLGIRSAVAFGSVSVRGLLGSAHPGSRPIHRGRSRPGWQNQLFRADSFL